MVETVQTQNLPQHVPSAEMKSSHQWRINEDFMNSLFKSSEAENVEAILGSLERSAKRLRELETPDNKKGWAHLTLGSFEEKVLQGRETFSVPKPAGITKQSKTKAKESKEQKDKFLENVLVKYSKDFFERVNKNTTVAQKKEIVHNLEQDWGFRSELKSNAHAIDYLNYIRKLWISYVLGKLQRSSAAREIGEHTSREGTSRTIHSISLQELQSLFNVETDCKDKQSVIAAFKRSEAFFRSKNFEHVIHSHVDSVATDKMGEEFDLKPLKNVTKTELEMEHMEELMEIESGEKVSDVAKHRRKNHKLFQERLLNKFSMPFFEGLKKLGVDVVRDIISDLALEWLFDKQHLKSHTEDGAPVPIDDVINFLRHTWILRIRCKLDLDHRELARLLSEREREVAKFCRTSMENLHKAAIDHAGENQGRPVVKVGEWENLETSIETKVREVFEEIKNKVYQPHSSHHH